VEKIIEQCWQIESLRDAGELVRASVPVGVASR
jgi:hypothetical protein